MVAVNQFGEAFFSQVSEAAVQQRLRCFDTSIRQPGRSPGDKILLGSRQTERGWPIQQKTPEALMQYLAPEFSIIGRPARHLRSSGKRRLGNHSLGTGAQRIKIGHRLDDRLGRLANKQARHGWPG